MKIRKLTQTGIMAAFTLMLLCNANAAENGKQAVTDQQEAYENNAVLMEENGGATDHHYYTDGAEEAFGQSQSLDVNKAFRSIAQAERYAGFHIVPTKMPGFTLGSINVTKSAGTSSIGIAYQGEGKSVEIEYSCYKAAHSWDRSEYYPDGIEKSYSYQNKYGFTITVQKINADIATHYVSIAFPDYYIHICFEGVGVQELNDILDTMDFSIYEG